MNLFRSEEHARNWDGYTDVMAASLKPVAEWADIFASPFFRERGRADYISWTRSDAARGIYADLRSRFPQVVED